jgi:DNA invertase Pin-like site-specific DNA recombinase
MKLIGYARRSAFTDDLEAQRTQLRSAGCEVVFEDSAADPGVGFAGALEAAGSGDTLVVCALSRLGGSMRRMVHAILDLRRREVGFRSLAENLHLEGSDKGEGLALLEALANADMDTQLEQWSALSEARAARRDGLGRKPKLLTAEVDRAVEAIMTGTATVAGFAQSLGVSRNTLSRALGRRSDYIRLTKAQAAELDAMATEIQSAAEHIAERVDRTIEEVNRLLSPEHIAERERAVREELKQDPLYIELLRQFGSAGHSAPSRH